jgi:hypothetical protein
VASCTIQENTWVKYVANFQLDLTPERTFCRRCIRKRREGPNRRRQAWKRKSR